jgi:Ca-activated chloride channel family protein
MSVVRRVAGAGRLAAVVACTILLPLPQLPRADAAGAPGVRVQAFHSTSSELVVLPVVVTDRSDHSIPGLQLDQFTVYDNERRVPIELFSAEDTPVTIGLVIDASGSMGPKLGEAIAGSLAFARSSNPDDELFVIRFNEDVRFALTDRRFLLASDLADLDRVLSSLVAEGRTALYDALVTGLDRLEEGSRPRKVLVLISDGGDNASRATLKTVLALARRSNAAIYTIGVFDDADTDKNPGLLKSLARTTGGRPFLPRSAGPLLSSCERIAKEIRSGYTIGYVPPDRDGAFHRVRVEVASPDKRKLTIRTRPGYFAGGPGV